MNEKIEDLYLAYLRGEDVSPPLNVMSIIHQSKVNGPGERTVIWTQGCSKGCFKCFNPESWTTDITTLRWGSELASEIMQSNPYGITLTGGDPFEQPRALLDFLNHLPTPNDEILPGGIICFTGYEMSEITDHPELSQCIQKIDLIIDGRYVDALRRYDTLSGSSNQKFHFLNIPGRGKDRISSESIEFDQEVEVFLSGESIQITGFPDINHRMLRKLGLHPLKRHSKDL